MDAVGLLQEAVDLVQVVLASENRWCAAGLEANVEIGRDVRHPLEPFHTTGCLAWIATIASCLESVGRTPKPSRSGQSSSLCTRRREQPKSRRARRPMPLTTASNISKLERASRISDSLCHSMRSRQSSSLAYMTS